MVNRWLYFVFNDSLFNLFKDTRSCFDYVYNTIKETPIEMCLLSTLRHLLLIRDDIHVKYVILIKKKKTLIFFSFIKIRYAYFRLIEECVSKIVLHRDGRDPDFDCGSKFVIDLETLLSKL